MALGSRLVRKKLGFRTLMDVIPLDAGLVKGSHGRIPDDPSKGPLLISSEPDLLDDDKAPDYARTVDIHRKPGYDPVELFLDPAIRVPPLALGSRLVRKKLGFRTLMDVIPLDASLVKGSHGRIPDDASKGPLLLTRQQDLIEDGELAATGVHDLILRHLGVPVREAAAR